MYLCSAHRLRPGADILKESAFRSFRRRELRQLTSKDGSWENSAPLCGRHVRHQSDVSPEGGGSSSHSSCKERKLHAGEGLSGGFAFFQHAYSDTKRTLIQKSASSGR